MVMTEQELRSRFASWSLTLGVAGCFSLLIPFLTLPLGVLAAVFGGLSLHRGEYRRNRAVAGIVLGCCLILTGAVLLYCMAALRPYEAQLMKLWEDTLKRMR